MEIWSSDVLQVLLFCNSSLSIAAEIFQFCRPFNANQLQSNHRFQSSVKFSVQFDLRLHKLNFQEKEVWKQSYRDGEEVKIICFT